MAEYQQLYWKVRASPRFGCRADVGREAEATSLLVDGGLLARWQQRQLGGHEQVLEGEAVRAAIPHLLSASSTATGTKAPRAATHRDRKSVV